MILQKMACHRLSGLHVPRNDATICWWLSVNLAIFHKSRPEFDAFFRDHAKGGVITDVFKQIYDHYTGRNAITDMELLRKGFRDQLAAQILATMKTNDTKEAETKEPETKEASPLAVKFKYDSGVFQAADEYLLEGILKYLSPRASPFYTIVTASPADNKLALLYDMYLHGLYFGLPKKTDGPASGTLKSYYDFLPEENELRSEMSTLILQFGRQLGNDGEIHHYEVTPLQSITLPTLRQGVEKPQLPSIEGKEGWLAWGKAVKEVTDTTEFYLDAMIVLQNENHFVTYVKCEETDAWIYDNGLTEGALGRKAGSAVFPSFHAMMAEHGNAIRGNVMLMFYTKYAAVFVKNADKSVSLNLLEFYNDLAKIELPKNIDFINIDFLIDCLITVLSEEDLTGDPNHDIFMQLREKYKRSVEAFHSMHIPKLKKIQFVNNLKEVAHRAIGRYDVKTKEAMVSFLESQPKAFYNMILGSV